jgi:hypothetical protein
MPFFLFVQQLFESVHEFVVAKLFYRRFLLVAQFAFQSLGQPIERDVRTLLKDRVYPLEIHAERFIEFVVMRFILHHDRTRQEIKIVE